MLKMKTGTHNTIISHKTFKAIPALAWTSYQEIICGFSRMKATFKWWEGQGFG